METTVIVEKHCDHPLCSMGSAQYTCPWCSRQDTDYDELWYGHESMSDEGIIFECPVCDQHSVFYWNQETHEYKLKPKK